MAKIQRDDRMKLLKIEIENEYMKNIHEIIILSLEVESIQLVFSSISPTSRVGVEKKYCIRLMSMVDLMYPETLLPHSFWDYAVITTSYILNHTPSSSGPKTPFKLYMGYKDNLEYLCIWGCEVYPHVIDEDQYGKDMKRCFLIGYP